MSTGCLKGWVCMAAICVLPSSWSITVWQELQSLLMTLPSLLTWLPSWQRKQPVIVEVSDVVGMRLPVHLHVGKERGAVDALQLRHCALDAVGFAGGDLRILVLVELVDVVGNRLLRLVAGLVVGGQHLRRPAA